MVMVCFLRLSIVYVATDSLDANELKLEKSWIIFQVLMPFRRACKNYQEKLLWLVLPDKFV